MKYLRQFIIIIAISFVGEVLRYLIPLPVPASIYGLVIMLVLLGTKRLSLEQVKETGVFLVEIMPVMFIPAAVGLMDSWSELKPMLLPFSVITFCVTVFVMVCAGHTAQFIIRHGKRSAKMENAGKSDMHQGYTKSEGMREKMIKTENAAPELERQILNKENGQ